MCCQKKLSVGPVKKMSKSCTGYKSRKPWNSNSQPFWHQGPISWKTIFPRTGGWEGGLGMIQEHYIYCALYICYYYTSSTSGHQALDSEVGGPWCKWLLNSVPFLSTHRLMLFVPTNNLPLRPLLQSPRPPSPVLLFFSLFLKYTRQLMPRGSCIILFCLPLSTPTDCHGFLTSWRLFLTCHITRQTLSHHFCTLPNPRLCSTLLNGTYHLSIWL